MVNDGLFEQFPMQAVFGMHNWPGMKAGTMAVGAGPAMASSNEFRIVVRGKGGHAAMPHMVVDPVPVAAQLIMAFQTIVSRNVKPIEAGVVSVTMVHAGEATNVVPDSVELQGTVRTFTLEVLDLIEQRMQQISEAVCAAHGTQCTFEFVRNYPPTINTAPEAEFAQAVMREILGDAGVVPQEPSMGAEDFAFMLLEKPGAYCFIANGDGDHRALGMAAALHLAQPQLRLQRCADSAGRDLLGQAGPALAGPAYARLKAWAAAWVEDFFHARPRAGSQRAC
jgi:hippurate hydrolase